MLHACKDTTFYRNLHYFFKFYLLFEQNHGDKSSKSRIFAAEIAILYIINEDSSNGCVGFYRQLHRRRSLATRHGNLGGSSPYQSRKYLQDERIHFINLNLSSEEELEKELAPHEFDYIVHAAGATKCLHAEDFYKVNTEGTKHLVNAILHLGMPIKRFVFVSSLSIFGAIREEQPYQEICETDVPKPNTAYGKSKLAAERYLDSIGNNFPYIILRPTAYMVQEKKTISSWRKASDSTWILL